MVVLVYESRVTGGVCPECKRRSQLVLFHRRGARFNIDLGVRIHFETTWIELVPVMRLLTELA